jgi:hypothetical protein
MRQQLREDGNVFASIFKDADLTQVERIKQWRNVVIYSSGKIVQRQERMAEADLFVAMNKAYYLRLQVIFEDVATRTSYWANHFDFDCTFAQMMTQTFGVGSARPGFFFDYGDNEELDAAQVEAAKAQWTSPFLWKKYGELKTDMQSQLLPVFFKQRIKAVGDSYEFSTGGSLAEVTWSFLGAMFQVFVVANAVLFFLSIAIADRCKLQISRSCEEGDSQPSEECCHWWCRPCAGSPPSRRRRRRRR